jgi:hypothetical protein
MAVVIDTPSGQSPASDPSLDCNAKFGLVTYTTKPERMQQKSWMILLDLNCDLKYTAAVFQDLPLYCVIIIDKLLNKGRLPVSPGSIPGI